MIRLWAMLGVGLVVAGASLAYLVATEPDEDGHPGTDVPAPRAHDPDRGASLPKEDGDVVTDPTVGERYEPTDDDVDFAVRAVTRVDSGRRIVPHRWEQAVVTYDHRGDQADDAQAEVRDILDWLEVVTGLEFEPSDDPQTADLRITTSEGVPARALVRAEDGRIRRAEVTADAVWHRWLWEELVHAMGPLADHPTRTDTVLSDQPDQEVAGEVDAWMLHRLYAADTLPADEESVRELFEGR